MLWAFTLKSTQLFTSALKDSAHVHTLMSTCVNVFMWLFYHDQYYFGYVYPEIIITIFSTVS